MIERPLKAFSEVDHRQSSSLLLLYLPLSRSPNTPEKVIEEKLRGCSNAAQV